jgi:hypothetical protein
MALYHEHTVDYLAGAPQRRLAGRLREMPTVHTFGGRGSPKTPAF